MAGSRETQGSVAVVPAGRIPRVGQTFGSMSLPPGRVQAEPTVAVPRWGDLAPAPWTPPPVTTPERPEEHAPEPEPEADLHVHAAHPYTWRHMAVLVLVAFVLAMLITMVVQNDPSTPGAQGAGSPTPVVAVATTAWTNLTTGE